MADTAPHHCRVLGSPWPGVHGVQTDSARHFGRHWHGSFGIGLLERGAQHSASGRGAVQAFAGDLITSNPGEVHDGRPLGDDSRRWQMVHLDPEVIAAMAAPGQGRFEVEWTRPVIQDAPLRAALQRLLGRMARWSAGQAATDADRLACEESLVQTCGLLLSRHSTAAPAKEGADGALMARVRERLADAVLDAPALTELAALAGLSKFQLLRRFNQAYGLPPHAWLLQQRVERARRLIRDGEDLATAALASGFADQSHMTRLFGRHFGFTPGAWQQAAARRPAQ